MNNNLRRLALASVWLPFVAFFAFNLAGKVLDGDEESRPALAPTTITEVGLDSFKIVSTEVLESGLPEYWKVDIVHGNNVVTVLVSKSTPKSELSQGKMILITRLNEMGRGLNGLLMFPCLGTPVLTSTGK